MASVMSLSLPKYVSLFTVVYPPSTSGADETYDTLGFYGSVADGVVFVLGDVGYAHLGD